MGKVTANPNIAKGSSVSVDERSDRETWGNPGAPSGRTQARVGTPMAMEKNTRAQKVRRVPAGRSKRTI